MNKEQFHKRLKEILAANRGPYNSPDKEFHLAMAAQVKGQSGMEWDEGVAAQIIRQLEAMTGTKPKSIELPEDQIKQILSDFLKVRAYEFVAIPEASTRTPDGYIEGAGRKYLCEIKSPVLNFDPETQLYKFKTTHRKILDFIHTAVKQFDELDSGHKIPRVLVFTSINPQLNWKSFTDAIQGGVVDQKGNVLPDFSKTTIYTSTLPLLSEVDMYVWLQVSGTGDQFYQASYFMNDKSKYIKLCRELVSSLSQLKLSSMDNSAFISFS